MLAGRYAVAPSRSPTLAGIVRPRARRKPQGVCLGGASSTIIYSENLRRWYTAPVPGFGAGNNGVLNIAVGNKALAVFTNNDATDPDGAVTRNFGKTWMTLSGCEAFVTDSAVNCQNPVKIFKCGKAVTFGNSGVPGNVAIDLDSGVVANISTSLPIASYSDLSLEKDLYVGYNLGNNTMLVAAAQSLSGDPSNGVSRQVTSMLTINNKQGGNQKFCCVAPDGTVARPAGGGFAQMEVFNPFTGREGRGLSRVGLTAFSNHPTYTGFMGMPVSFGNGIFVAACAGGVVSLSPDGFVWRDVSVGFTSNDLFVSVFNGAEFVVAGEGGVAGRSIDGINWTAIATGTANALYCGAVGDLNVVAS